MAERREISRQELEADVESDALVCCNDLGGTHHSWPLSHVYSEYFDKEQLDVVEMRKDLGRHSDCSVDSGISSGMSGSSALLDDEGCLHFHMSCMNIDESKNISDNKCVSVDSGIDTGNFKSLLDEFKDKDCLNREPVNESNTSSSSSSSPSPPLISVKHDYMFDDSHLSCLNFTTSQKIDLYRQDAEGDTQLHIAIIQCMGDELLYEMVVAIIRFALSPSYLNIQNLLFQTPLILATLTKQAHVVRQLVLAGASITSTDRNGDTALSIACRNGDLETVKALMMSSMLTPGNHYQDSLIISKVIDKKNYEGLSPAHLAVIGGHLHVLEFLHACGADINATCEKTGENILHIAVKCNNRQLLEGVCIYPVNAEAMTFSQMTPLNLAVELRLNDVAEFLINNLSVDRSEIEFYPVEDDFSEEDMEDDFTINGQPIT